MNMFIKSIAGIFGGGFKMPKIIKDPEERILQAARKRLLDSDLSSFSLRGVASDCGIAVGTIYNYFKDKENLFNDMMHLVAEKMYSITEAIDYSQKAEIALRELIDSLLGKLNSSELMKFDSNYACMFYLILNLHLQRDFVPKPRVDISNRPLERKRLFEIIYYLIEKGQKEGSIKESEFLSP